MHLSTQEQGGGVEKDLIKDKTRYSQIQIQTKGKLKINLDGSNTVVSRQEITDTALQEEMVKLPPWEMHKL